MDDYPVKVGAMLFTMVDPHRGYEIAYNRWYERDHYYGGVLTGPHVLAGSRWVATRPLKDLRFPADSPFAEPLDAGSYLAVYWFEKGAEEAQNAWGGPQARHLYATGRGFNERTHAHTGLYTFASSVNADDDGVPVELALDHCYAALGVVVVEPGEGMTRDELGTMLDHGPVRELLSEPGVDIAASWTAQPMDSAQSPMALGTDGGSPQRLVQLFFLDRDPREVWPAFHAYADAVTAGGGKVTFAAPFLRTVVGTDRYVDEIW